MPKLKTKSGAKKRFHFTGSGKIRRNYAFSVIKLTFKPEAVRFGFGGRNYDKSACQTYPPSRTSVPRARPKAI